MNLDLLFQEMENNAMNFSADDEVFFTQLKNIFVNLDKVDKILIGHHRNLNEADLLATNDSINKITELVIISRKNVLGDLGSLLNDKKIKKKYG